MAFGYGAGCELHAGLNNLEKEGSKQWQREE